MAFIKISKIVWMTAGAFKREPVCDAEILHQPPRVTTQILRQNSGCRHCLQGVFIFTDARNLEASTPLWLNFHSLTPGEIKMKVGAIINYKLRIHGFSVRRTD